MIRRPPRSTLFPSRRSSDLEAEAGDEVGLIECAGELVGDPARVQRLGELDLEQRVEDRKSTRLNSSHSQISYAVFCLKKKKTYNIILLCLETHPLRRLPSTY